MENTEKKVQESGLVALFVEHEIPKETALVLSSSFQEFYDQVQEWKKNAAEFLANPEISEEEKAKEARKGRLALVKVRTGIDKKRKELNDTDAKAITTRNEAAGALTGLVTPLEQELAEVEKKAEREEEERKNKLKESRETSLKNYNVDCQFFDLKNMPDEAFKILLDNSVIAFRAKAEELEREEKRKAHEAIINMRTNDLRDIGFKSENGTDFSHPFGLDFDGEDIQNTTQEQFEKKFRETVAEIQRIDKIKTEEKEAEENRLKAEKEELERKNLLLQQQEKERQQKHNAAVYRQQAAARMNIVLSYEEAAEMTEPGWTEWFNAKNSEYEAEQNRLFIEKKKKERDEAIAKAAEEIKQRRILELKSFGYEFDEVNQNYARKDFGFVYHVENYDTETWGNLIERIKSQIEAARIAELAPDKDKMYLWLKTNIVHSDITMYHSDLSEDAKKVASEIYAKFNGFKKWAEGEIEKLK